MTPLPLASLTRFSEKTPLPRSPLATRFGEKTPLPTFKPPTKPVDEKPEDAAGEAPTKDAKPAKPDAKPAKPAKPAGKFNRPTPVAEAAARLERSPAVSVPPYQKGSGLCAKANSSPPSCPVHAPVAEIGGLQRKGQALLALDGAQLGALLGCQVTHHQDERR